MKLSRLVNTFRKRLFAGALVALAVALPVATSAADIVKIEGVMGVANVTAGDTSYKPAVNASYNQVVKLQVYYHNTEMPDSGKVANNLRVKINIPTTPGTTQTQTATISADNSNTVTSTTKVNLTRSDAFLQYIPGSAVWRHNTGTNANPNMVDTTISDNVVLGGSGVVLENEKPCFNFAATVTVMARVMVPGVSITKQVRAKGTTSWSTSMTANPGDTVQYMISYQNTGNSSENNVVVGDKLPNGVGYVPGTTKLANQSAPSGKSVSDGVTTSGIMIGSYGPGTNAFVMFDAKLPSASQLTCGDNLLRNIATVQPQGMNYFYNTADVHINKQCVTPTVSCDAFHVVADNSSRSVKVDQFSTSTTNGVTFSDAVVNWGDNTTPLTTNNVIGQMHSYATSAGNGPFTITATARFSNGATATGNCTQTVNFTPSVTPPSELPNTGAGDTIGLFAGVSVVSALGYRLFLSRKLSRQ